MSGSQPTIGTYFSSKPLADPLTDDDAFPVIQGRTGATPAPKLRLHTWAALRIAIGAYLSALNDAYVNGAQEYAEDRAAAALVAANLYTDQKGDPASILATANAHADTAANTAQGAAQGYTLDQIAQLRGYVDTADQATLQAAKVYTDTHAVQSATGALAPIDSPNFIGTPTTPTPTAGISSTQIANMAAVRTEIANLVGTAPTTLDTLNELAGALGNDPNFATTVTNSLALKAPLVSPALTGTPTAPTAAAGTNTTQLATTAYVVGQAATATPNGPGTATVGTSLRYAREDHVHPRDTTKADLASPAFTGNPTAPTQISSDNSTRLATTAFVQNAVSGVAAGGVTNLDGLTDVTISTPVAGQTLRNNGAGQFVNTNLGVGDVTGAAPLASPTFTGAPLAPTATAGTNTTQIATTAYVRGEITALINGSPAALDTLNELSAALGNDPNFATTVNNNIATKAPTASPTFAGTVTMPAGTATVAFEKWQSGATLTTPVFGALEFNGTNAFLTTNSASPTRQTFAFLASPAFLGTPTAPTPAALDNSTTIATTAYVISNAANTAPVMDGTATIGTSNRFARQDHVHPSDTTRAPVASPTFTGRARTGVQALTDAATIALDLSLANTYTVTLAGNRAMGTPTNLAAGQDFKIIIRQDATGGRTLTWPATFKWPGGTAPTLSTAANARDVVQCYCDGTDIVANMLKAFA
jgi:hypothetical protein